ncbi:hypothetical protein ACVPOR_04445 [Staphylococcus aureus]
MSNHDDNGIVWPKLSLYLISTFNFINFFAKKDDQRELADALYAEFSTKFDVLYDDRQERGEG